MNWQVFSTIGYVSVGLWLLVPVLWGLHLLIRPARWIAHVAVLVGIGALILAEVNSSSHVARIVVDRSDEIEAQLSRQAMARQAAEAERASEVAQIWFPEDDAGDFLDTAGLDDADRAYFDQITDETPAWKKERRERSQGLAESGDLESMIDDTPERGGVASAEIFEQPAESEPILMSDQDKALANRLDIANLRATQLVLLFAVLFVVFDYVRRLNNHREVYCPLPLPSAWPDALRDRPPLLELPDTPRKSLVDELSVMTRRGEPFIYFTDRPERAKVLLDAAYHRWPLGLSHMEVLNPCHESTMTDEFVFESLWFARYNFVVDSERRGHAILEKFLKLLEERRGSRARTRYRVNLVWELAQPIPDATKQHLVELGKAVGFTLVLCPTARTSENQS